MSPTSQAFSMMSCGQVPSLSYSQALGRISFSAKSCASSRNAFCSSVSVKSTTVSLVSLQFSAGPLGVRDARLTGQSILSTPRVPAR
jgi:hypothetical protein